LVGGVDGPGDGGGGGGVLLLLSRSSLSPHLPPQLQLCESTKVDRVLSPSEGTPEGAPSQATSSCCCSS
jgi:hypothetical protein